MPVGQSADQPLPRVPLVVPLESRYGDLHTDPQLINAYAEKTEGGDFKVYQRDGVAQYQTLTPPTGFNITNALGQYVADTTHAGGASTDVYTFVSVYKNTLPTARGVYVYTNGASPVAIDTSIGGGGYVDAVAYSNSSQVQIALLPVVAFDLHAAQIYVYNADTNAVTLSTFVGPAHPSLMARGMVFLDQTIYVMDYTAKIYGSNLNDATIFDALNFIVASDLPGAGKAIARHESFVVALKENSVEFFYDAANPTGSPLSALPNSTIHWGCVDGGSVQDIEGKLFWVARSKQASAFVAMLDHRQHSRISTEGVERLLDDFQNPIDSFAFKDMGHLFYGFTSQGSNITLVYDLMQKIWYVWTDAKGNFWPWRSFVTSTTWTVSVQSTDDSLAANTYQIDEEFATDLGVAIPVDIYTGNYDSGSRRRDVLQRMDFIVDQQPGKLKVRYTEDDYKTWSNFREVDLNQKRPTLINCGSFRRRAWNFRWQAGLPLRVEAVELTVIPGVA